MAMRAALLALCALSSTAFHAPRRLSAPRRCAAPCGALPGGASFSVEVCGCDAALAIDPSDAALAQHMRPILEAVFAGLHECATAPETPAPVKNDLRLCIHVVNSLLTACK